MGLFDSIKSAFSGGGLKSLIGDGLKSLTGGEGIGGLIKKGLSGLMDKFMPKINDLLTNSKFAQMANKFIDFAGKVGPKMAESGGFMGMLGGLLSKVGGMGSLSNIAETLLGKLGGSGALGQAGLGNLAEMFAQRQAQLMQP